MLARPKSFSGLYGIQRNFLNLFYLISVVAVFWLIFYLLHEILNAGGSVIVPVSLAYLVLIVLGYSIIQVVSFIPANLAGAFDPIKNGIADGSIHSLPLMAEKLAGFMCSFFNFTFFDIQTALVHFKGNKPVHSTSEDWGDTDTSAIETYANSVNEASFYGKISTRSGSGFVYVIPLIFGEKRLGYIAVKTKQKLMKIFVRLLSEFENDFVDDQVVHVMANEAGSIV